MNGRPIEFELSRNDKKPEPTNFAGGAVGTFHTPTELNKLFFDKMNIDAIQHGIRYGVYKKTCGKSVIDNQDQTSLLVVMRSIYLQNSKNLDVEIIEQVRELNSKVLDYSIDRIIGEINMHDKYLADRETISFRTNPINVSKAGTRNL